MLGLELVTLSLRWLVLDLDPDSRLTLLLLLVLVVRVEVEEATEAVELRGGARRPSITQPLLLPPTTAMYIGLL